MKLERLSLVELDVSILFRAFAIISIVASHFGALNLPGGSGYLFLLSGYNFVQFMMPKINTSANTKTTQYLQPYGRYMRKLLVPSVLYIGFVFILVREFHVYSIFFVSNFVGPGYAGGLTYWFIDVLVQMFVLLGVLLAYGPTRRYLFAQPFNFFLGAVLISFMVRTASMYFFDTSDLLNRLPHLYFPIFVLGGLIAYSDSMKQKLLASTSIILVSSPLLFEQSTIAPLLLIGGFAALWTSTIKFPELLVGLVTKIALSSLFIYLCHFQAKSFLSKLITNPNPFLSLAVAIMVGIVFAQVWKERKQIRNTFYQKMRFARWAIPLRRRLS